mgnify:CR=1 FL=1
MNQADLGVVRAVFEDLGGVQAVAREQGEGPLVSHLQRNNIQLAASPVFVRKGLADTTKGSKKDHSSSVSSPRINADLHTEDQRGITPAPAWESPACQFVHAA